MNERVVDTASLRKRRVVSGRGNRDDIPHPGLSLPFPATCWQERTAVRWIMKQKSHSTPLRACMDVDRVPAGFMVDETQSSLRGHGSSWDVCGSQRKVRLQNGLSTPADHVCRWNELYGT